jgi:hypothetical protein
MPRKTVKKPKGESVITHRGKTRTSMIKHLLVQCQFTDEKIHAIVQDRFGAFRKAEIAVARHALNTGITGKTLMADHGLAHIRRIE